MKTKEFIKKRNAIKKELAVCQKYADKAYNMLCTDFRKAHSPVEVGKVYELVENGITHKACTRFIVYAQDVQCVLDNPIIRVGGWWLDKNSDPKKWVTMTVFGVGNNAVFKLSKNQVNHKPSVKI